VSQYTRTVPLLHHSLFAHSIKTNQNGMANCDNRRAFRAFLIVSMNSLHDYGYWNERRWKMATKQRRN
jgi:hypothetical protein